MAQGTTVNLQSAVVTVLSGSAVRVVVSERVETAPRLVTSLTRPGRDPQSALSAAEQLLGRKLLAEGARIQPRTRLGDGADAWLTVGYPGELPRLAIVEVGAGDATLAEVICAVRAAAVRVLRLRAEGEIQPTVLAQKLREYAPVYLLLTGQAGEATWQAVSVAVQIAFDEAAMPEFGIVVAPEPVQERIAALWGGRIELVGVDPQKFPPSDIMSAISSELRQRVEARLQKELNEAFQGHVRHRLTALERAASFLVRRAEQRLILADFDLGVLTLWARPEGLLTLYEADADLGQGALALSELDFRAVSRWLPWPITSDDLLDWLANRRLKPHPMILGKYDQLLAAAVLREALRRLAAEIEPDSVREDVTLVVLGPSFVTLPPALASLVALDAFEPVPATGIVSVGLDEADLLTVGGALAEEFPGYAAALIERDALLPLAHVVVVAGEGFEGAVAVRGELRTGAISQRFTVPWGSLHRLPIPAGGTAELILEPEVGVRIGGLEPGVAVRFVEGAALTWSQLGIVIDARGRPLRLPGDPAGSQRRQASWLADLGLEA